MKVLEEDVEKTLQREESILDAEEQIYSDDVQKVVQELKSKHNVSTVPGSRLSTDDRVPSSSRSSNCGNA